MTRVSQFRKRKRNLAAAVLVLALVAVALLADVLASDLPILIHRNGVTSFLPCLFRPAALAGQSNTALRSTATPNDFAIFPLVEWGPEEPDLDADPLSGPSKKHWLGVDDIGLDVASRLIHGTRVSLAVGLIAVSIYVAIGVLLGALAGFYGGAIDLLLSRLTEIMLVFPTFFLILTIMGLLERTTIVSVMVVIGLTRWTDVQRLLRAEVLRIRELDYVQASRALGASNVRILWRHVIPNALAPVFVSATFGVAGAILLESSLSFLGFGTPPPTASWGALLNQGYEHAADGAWWLTLFPGLAIFITVTAYNLLGEGLRDALDPRLK